MRNRQKSVSMLADGRSWRKCDMGREIGENRSVTAKSSNSHIQCECRSPIPRESSISPEFNAKVQISITSCPDAYREHGNREIVREFPRMGESRESRHHFGAGRPSLFPLGSNRSGLQEAGGPALGNSARFRGRWLAGPGPNTQQRRVRRVPPSGQGRRAAPGVPVGPVSPLASGRAPPLPSLCSGPLCSGP